MITITNWGVFSSRLDQLLARGGCPHCDSSFGRLTQHRAGFDHVQIWFSCASCGARLGGALAHIDHPRRFACPLSLSDSSRRRPPKIPDAKAKP